MKYLSILFALTFIFPSYGGGVSRSRARIVNHYNDVDRVVIEQKIVQYGDSQLSIIAVPVTDVGLQYYYQTELLRGRGLSEEDRKAIVEEVVSGVLAGIDERFEIVPQDGKDGNVGGGNDGNVGNEPPSQGSSNTGTELDTKVLALMKAECATCHTEGLLEKPGMPVLLTKGGELAKLTDIKDEKLRRVAIWDSTFEGRMPKNGHVLSDADVKTLKDWFKEFK